MARQLRRHEGACTRPRLGQTVGGGRRITLAQFLKRLFALRTRSVAVVVRAACVQSVWRKAASVGVCPWAWVRAVCAAGAVLRSQQRDFVQQMYDIDLTY